MSITDNIEQLTERFQSMDEAIQAGHGPAGRRRPSGIYLPTVILMCAGLIVLAVLITIS